MNWGKKIALVYVAFVGLIATLVTISMNQEIELESKDYYAQELKYQEKIDALNNTNEMKEDITINRNENEVLIHFPIEQKGSISEGEIIFFCANDFHKDQKFKLSIDAENNQRIPFEQLQKAKYTLKISWKANSKNYFKEVPFTLL